MINLGLSTKFGLATTNGKTVSNEPIVSLTSTKSRFKLKPSVTKALQLVHGDSVALIHNIDGLNDLLNNPTDELIALAESKSMEVTSKEFRQLILDENTVWAFVKGYQLYDKNGKELYSKDKVTGKDELRLAGAKVASTAAVKGYGQSLEFSDAVNWDILKSDLVGDDKFNTVRDYTVDIENPISISVFNGYEEIEATAFIMDLSTKVDNSKIARGSKKAEAEAETEA